MGRLFLQPFPWRRLVLVGSLLLLLASPPVRAQDKQAASIRDYNVAAALQNAGFYPRAAERWAEFLKKYPKETRLDRATYYLGICQLHTKKFPESSATFQLLIGKYPKFVDLDGAYYNLAMCSYQLAVVSKKPEAYVKAATEFDTMLKKYPKSMFAPQACYFQGESFYAAQKLKEAATSYLVLISNYASSPLLPDALYALGTTQQELQQHLEAEATFNKFIANESLAKHPLAGEVQLRLGLVQFSQKKYAEADKLFAAAAAREKFPLADLALLRQGQCRLELGNYEQAIPLFTKMVSQFANSVHKPAAQLAAGRCYYQLEKFADASKLLEPLARQKIAQSPEAAYWLARGFIKQKSPQEAFAILEEVAGTADKSEFLPYIQLTRIDALYEIPQRRKETVALYDAFVKQHPKHSLAPQAHYMSAFTALGEKDFPLARSRAEAFLGTAEYQKHELTPALLFIAGEGYLLVDDQAAAAENRTKAQTFYQRLVTEYPQHNRFSAAQLRIAWCFYQSDKFNESVALLKGILPKLTEAPQKADANFLIGRNSSSLKKEAEAIAAYDAALGADPKWPRIDEVLLAAGRSHRTLKNLPAAIGRFKELAAKYPNSSQRPAALFELGDIAQKDGKHDQAIAYFTEVQQKYAASQFGPVSQYGLGSACYAKQDYAAAQKHLAALLASKPNEKLLNRAHYLQGLTYQGLKQFPAGIKELLLFIASKPGGDVLSDAKYALALCHIGAKQPDPAIVVLKELHAAQPAYAYDDKVLYELAHTQLVKMLAAEATATFKLLAQTHKESSLAAESWFHVGQFHSGVAAETKQPATQTAQWKAADQAYTAGLASKPSPELHEKLFYKLADARFQMKDYAEANKILQQQISTFAQGILVDPARFLSAECFYQQNDFTQALPLFTLVASRKVEAYQDQALYRAGTCAANLKQWEPSRQHFDALIKKSPKFDQVHEARYGLAWAHQQLKQLPQSRALYEQITRETETITAAKARFMIGELDFGEGKYESAIEQFLSVAVGYPFKEWRAMGHFEAARCFIQLKQNDKAIASLQVIIREHADHPKAKDAAKLLTELKK